MGHIDKCPKLSVLLFVCTYSKLNFHILNNQLVYFGVISVENVALDDLVGSNFSLWIRMLTPYHTWGDVLYMISNLRRHWVITASGPSQPGGTKLDMLAAFTLAKLYQFIIRGVKAVYGDGLTISWDGRQSVRRGRSIHGECEWRRGIGIWTSRTHGGAWVQKILQGQSPQ